MTPYVRVWVCLCVCAWALWLRGRGSRPRCLLTRCHLDCHPNLWEAPHRGQRWLFLVRRGFWQLPFYFADWQQFFTLSPSHVSTHIIFICISRVPLTHLHGHAYVYSYADVCIARESEYIYLRVLESMTDLRPSRIVLGKLPFFSNFYD